jgi:hypothetical protein
MNPKALASALLFAIAFWITAGYFIYVSLQ